jgi:hypothetical protein
MKLYKYTLKPQGLTDLALPAGAIVRHVGEQYRVLHLWAEVDPAAAVEARAFYAAFTGQEAPPGGSFIGTVVYSGGDFVAHVYELPQS